MPAGRYVVVGQPSAVVGLFNGMLGSLDTKYYETQASPFIEKIDQPIIDHRFRFHNRPDHQDLLGSGFTTFSPAISHLQFLSHPQFLEYH